MLKNEIITIDGPAGSGKSTIAKLLAHKLGWNYLDTGAMYRGFTYALLQRTKILHKKLNTDFIEREIDEISWDVEIGRDAENSAMPKTVFILEGSPVPDAKLRTSEISENIKLVADNLKIRRLCIEKQREIARAGKLITEGRDQGSVVFPNAKYKFYLDASVEERAKRRLKDQKKLGEDISIKILMRSIERRDFEDKSRAFGALTIPENAIIIDTTNLSVEQVIEKILEVIDKDGRANDA